MISTSPTSKPFTRLFFLRLGHSRPHASVFTDKFSATYNQTFSTESRPVFSNVRVLFRKIVTASAVFAFSVLSAGTYASQNINSMCDSFQVCRVHTGSVPAEVVDYQSSGDAALNEFVRDSMSLQIFPAVPESPVPRSFIVRSCLSERSSPHPTFFSLFNFRPELFHAYGDSVSKSGGQA